MSWVTLFLIVTYDYMRIADYKNTIVQIYTQRNIPVNQVF